ncbi:MAG TPA: HAD family hydrolase, partial [Thermoanaerobaculia bacterium]|nr:HAD family hydrolase [Thermoanaerobaculia bacterium]
DLWETLITNPHHITHAHKTLRLERLARLLSTTPDALETAYAYVWTRCQELYWSADKDVPCRTQIEHFVEALRVDVDETTMQALEEAYATVAIEALPVLVDGAIEVLRDLSSRFRLGLISNTGRTPGSALRVILDRLDLSKYFTAMVFSNEHGELKPRRSIFERLRSALDVEFNEMVFIGDNLYVDVYGAQGCGMKAVHFIPPQRGTAVAPDVNHGLTIEPDATIYDLRELPPLIQRFAPAQTRRS